jgi:hypothetical protein
MTFFPILLRLLRALTSNEFAPLGFHVNREIRGRGCASGRFREVGSGGPIGAKRAIGAMRTIGAMRAIGAIRAIIAASAPCGDAMTREFALKARVRANAFHDPPETA